MLSSGASQSLMSAAFFLCEGAPAWYSVARKAIEDIRYMGRDSEQDAVVADGLAAVLFGDGVAD